MPPLNPETTRGRGAIVATAAVVLVCALSVELPVLAQTDEESTEEPTPIAEGTVAVPPEEEEDRAPRVTSLTAAIPADSGVSVQTLCTNCNNANLSIAGYGNEHIALVCDGITVPSGLAQIYLLSVMPPTRIDKVDVEKGASDPTLLGGAVGGGIKIERVEPKDGVTVNVSADAGEYGWRAARADVTGRSGWFGGYFVGTFSQSDSIDANLDGWADLPEFERYTLEAGLDLVPGEPHRLRIGFGRYNEDQLDGPANAFLIRPKVCIGYEAVINNNGCTVGDPQVGYNRENVQLNRDQIDLSYNLSLDGGTRLSLTAALAEREQDIQETHAEPVTFNAFLPGDEQRLEDEHGLTVEELCNEHGICMGLPEPKYEPTYFIEDENRQATVTLTQPIGQQSVIRAGAMGIVSDFAVIDVLFNINGSLPADFQLKEKMTETGAWIEGETAIGSRVELLIGARFADFAYEDNEVRDQWLAIPLPEGDKVLPRAALTWKVLDELQFRFSAGKGLRAPAPAFDRVCCGRRYRGNRGVEMEESTSYGFEATYQPGPRYRVGLSMFHSDFDNQILNMAMWSDNDLPADTPGTSTVFNWVHTYQNVNMAKSRLRSVNLDAKFQAPMWMTTRVSYSWLDPENLSPGGAITGFVDPGTNPYEVTYYYDGVPYTTDRRGAFGFDFALPPQAALSLNVQYTGPMLIQRFSLDTLSGVADELAETEDFWVANVRFSKTFSMGFTVYAGVDNVLGYVQASGCDGDDAALNPSLVGCLGDPRYDFNWGPLRGRYIYAGLGYQFVN